MTNSHAIKLIGVVTSCFFFLQRKTAIPLLLITHVDNCIFYTAYSPHGSHLFGNNFYCYSLAIFCILGARFSTTTQLMRSSAIIDHTILPRRNIKWEEFVAETLVCIGMQNATHVHKLYHAYCAKLHGWKYPIHTNATATASVHATSIHFFLSKHEPWRR